MPLLQRGGGESLDSELPLGPPPPRPNSVSPSPRLTSVSTSSRPSVVSLPPGLSLCPPPAALPLCPHPPGPTSVSPPSSAGLVCAWPTFKAAVFGWEIRQWEPCLERPPGPTPDAGPQGGLPLPGQVAMGLSAGAPVKVLPALQAHRAPHSLPTCPALGNRYI